MPGPMQQKSDAELRRDRLRFYREEMSEINATLRGFLQRAKAAAAFLVDKDGHLITREGSTTRSTSTPSAGSSPAPSPRPSRWR